LKFYKVTGISTVLNGYENWVKKKVNKVLLVKIKLRRSVMGCARLQKLKIDDI
jgi:hypothetical protein